MTETLTSMEGRTIVRPGCTAELPRDHHRGDFNGGPDNCPARPETGGAEAAAHTHFNGGPDNCPARRPSSVQFSFNVTKLQWRAGQLSGQATRPPASTRRRICTSMEGRTIVRPGLPVLQRRARVRSTSMEGRTIVRPGTARRTAPNRHDRTSMEGRTIVRPGPRNLLGHPIGQYPEDFNGGPDNCPARPPPT